MIQLIGNNLVQIDIFDTAEDIFFDLRIFLCKLCNELFDHHRLETVRSSGLQVVQVSVK